MHLMAQEAARLGLTVQDPNTLRTLLSRFYTLCRQHHSLTLAAHLAEATARLVRPGLDPSTIGRLALKAWTLVAGPVPPGMDKNYWQNLNRLLAPANP